MSLQTQYRKILNQNHRILNICHKDLDGVASSIVVKNLYSNVTFQELKYGTVNEYLKNLDYDLYDVVLLTDISPESSHAFTYSDKIFLLDHHSTALEYHNPEQNRIVIEGKCAASLVKEFFENLFHVDLSYLDDFVSVVNDYDMWYLKDNRSWGLNELYFKYWDTNFRNRFKNGDMYFNVQEVDYIKKKRKDLDEAYQNLERHDFDDINGTLIIASTFLNDFCHKLMEEKGYDYVFCYNPKSKHVSVRNKRKDIHIGEVLKKLVGGGGHGASAAFQNKDYTELDAKLDIIEAYLKGK